MPVKVSMISLGCAKNMVDSEVMLSTLSDAGFEIVPSAENCDVAIVNTCGFIAAAVDEAVEQILTVAELKKAGVIRAIVVTGCMAERFQKEFRKELPEVDAVLGTGSYGRIVEAVKGVLHGEAPQFFENINRGSLGGERRLLTPQYTAYLKIAEGCDNHCAYCVIPSLRGKYRSRPTEEILEEARKLAQSGTRELIVIAQDITRYGLDLYGERRLRGLLSDLCKIDGFEWIRLHYLYPDEISDELIELVAREEKIVKYLDIPIQHISDRVLRDMNRRGNKEFILKLFHKIRERIPGVVLRTSIITGFPGETEEEFTELCDFLWTEKPERAGFFCYSREEGSAAYEMANQVPEEVKLRRQEILQDIGSRIADEFGLSMIGQKIRVLTERFDRKEKRYFGRSFADSPEIDGQVIFTAAGKILPGQFVTVEITAFEGYNLIGTASFEK